MHLLKALPKCVSAPRMLPCNRKGAPLPGGLLAGQPHLGRYKGLLVELRLKTQSGPRQMPVLIG